MSNFINYRFLSSKNFSKIHFHGQSLPLWELRTEIIQNQRMTSTDFDLLFFDDDHTPLLDDYHTINRLSNILVKRVPLWQSLRKEIPRKETIRKAPLNTPKPLFDTYVCFRCGNKGHFIQNCPTNTDRNYDYVRVRKPTGIPKAFLQSVPGDVSQPGMLVTEQGLVKVVPQLTEWHKLNTGGVKEFPAEMCCKRCLMVFDEAVILSCGHRFCAGCVDVYANCFLCGKIVDVIIEDFEMRKNVERFYEEH
ncbi:Protein mpe1 [Conglomerata obtusa]